MSKWWLPKVKAWIFTKHQLLKFVNSMETDFLFAAVTNPDSNVRGRGEVREIW